MRVTNGDIWAAREPLAELVKEVLPVKTAYWLAKLARKVAEHARDIEAVRVRLIREHGSADEKGNILVSPESEAWPAFAAAFNELMAEQVELEGLPMEKIALPSDNGLCVSAASLLALDAFLEVT